MSETVQKPAPLCWYCHTPTSEHFCSHCHKIQPLAAEEDYFHFLGLLRHFNLDLTALEQRFYALSRQFHPDFFSQTTVEERQYSLARSAMLNDAYRTLKDPLKRAYYLLEIEGFTKVDQRSNVPPDLLAEVFELNEQLDELRESKRLQAIEEMKRLKHSLLAIEADLNHRLQTLHTDLQTTFQQWQASKIAQQQLEQASDLLAEIKYINNLIENIQAEL